MAPKVTVLKVCIVCDKCKAKLLKAVAGLEGVNKIDTDEGKSTLTVVGEVDPQEIIVRARKVGVAEIISISDPKKPDETKKPDEKKKDDEKKPAHICPQPCYGYCCYRPGYDIVLPVPYDMPAPYPEQCCYRPGYGIVLPVPYDMPAPYPEQTCMIM